MREKFTIKPGLSRLGLDLTKLNGGENSVNGDRQSDQESAKDTHFGLWDGSFEYVQIIE